MPRSPDIEGVEVRTMMDSLKELLESTMVRWTIGLVSLGAAPIFLLSMVKAHLS